MKLFSWILPLLVLLPVSAVAGYPMISDIPNQQIAMNTSTDKIYFNVTDDTTDPSDLKVSASSMSPDLVRDSDIDLFGSGAVRMIKVTPIQGRSGMAVIVVRVEDKDGETNTDTFQIDIQRPPIGS